MLQRFRTIEDKLTQVQPPFHPAFQGADNWHWHWPEPEDIPTPAQPSLPKVQMPLPPLGSTALGDVSNRSVDGALIGHEYVIPQDDVDHWLILAGWLASRLFTKQEKCGSNTRGMCGNKALNVSEVKTIYSCCISNYPLERLETSTVAERDIRNAVDKVCRKTKVQREKFLPFSQSSCFHLSTYMYVVLVLV